MHNGHYRGFAFGDFELDIDRRVLSKAGETVNVNPKAFDLLVALVENHGRTLSKNVLLDKVWENQFVEENNLTVHVAALRRALGEKRGQYRFIVTVPGKGYRFVEDVEKLHTSEIVVASSEFQRFVVEEEAEENAFPTETSDLGLDRKEIAKEKTHRVDTGRLRKIAALVAIPATLIALVLGYWIYFTDPKGTTGAPFQQTAFTRLTSNGRVNTATLSPDGKYFVYALAEDQGQSLWVRQVSESRSIQLLPADAVEYWGLTFSPDNTQIYGTVFTAKQADPLLIRLPVLGGAVEELPNVSCSRVSFSPDGKRFAYVVSSSGSGGTLLRTANADGSHDKVLSILKDPSYFVFPGATVAWSPDGQTIAAAAKIVDETGDYGAVMQIRIADGSMSPVAMRRFPRIESVIWTPKGDGLIFTANDDAGSPTQIWYQSIGGAEAVRLTNDLNYYSSIAANSGGNEMVAVQLTTNSSIWVADHVGDIGKPNKIASETIDYGEIGWNSESHLVYRSRASGRQNIWTMTAGGADPKQLTTDGLPDKGLSVSPDGRFILFSSYRSGKYNIWRVNADGSGLTQLTNGEGEVYPRISPDRQWFLYQSGVGEVSSTIWRMPIGGGNAHRITRSHSIYPSLSPDGSLVSYFYMDTSTTGKGEWRVAIARTDNGAVVHSFKMPSNIIGRVARWAPDGQSIVYAKANGNVGDLWRQPLDGSEPVQITYFDSYSIGDFAWSPDGKKIALTRGSEIRDVVLIRQDQ